MSAPHPRVSAVIPVYNEEGNLAELNERMLRALEGTGKTWELIYVDDGSADRSLDLLAGFAAKEPRIRVVEFNRNYGQHAAVFAGLAQTRGDIVVTLDADLQNPPEEVPKLVAKMEEGFDVVGSVRKNRQDPFLRKIASRLVNRLTRSGNRAAHGMSDYGCMLRAYSRNIVDQISQCRELSSFIPVLAMLYAKKTTEIPVEHAERARGSSKYGLLQLIRLQSDLMTGFSFLPRRTGRGLRVRPFGLHLREAPPSRGRHLGPVRSLHALCGALPDGRRALHRTGNPGGIRGSHLRRGAAAAPLRRAQGPRDGGVSGRPR